MTHNGVGVDNQFGHDAERKCYSFVHRPDSADWTQSGVLYMAPAPHLSKMWSGHDFGVKWDAIQWEDGQGHCKCPDTPPSSGSVNPAWQNDFNKPTVFVCPSIFELDAQQGTQGGIAMSETLIHEFMHQLGVDDGSVPA